MNEVFMSRQPLVNRQSRIIATRLTLHLSNGAACIVDAVSALSALADVWPPGENRCSSVAAATVMRACSTGSTPENATIELPAAALLGPQGPDLIAALQTWQPTVCLHFDPQAAQAWRPACRTASSASTPARFTLVPTQAAGGPDPIVRHRYRFQCRYTARISGPAWMPG
jgi:hypothetical protein